MEKQFAFFEHERARHGTDEWLTPPEIIEALGPFDLDPCASINQPWPTAARHYTILDNGLVLPWQNRVWLNPPYGNQTGRWLARMAEHHNGIALIYARTETSNFFKYVWPTADALLFVQGRLTFYDVSGKAARQSAGGPSVLIAYGLYNADRLRNSGIKGAFVEGPFVLT